jgi:GTP-binding protein
VRREGDGWRVAGRGVERWVEGTDLDDERQVGRLQRRLIDEGVERQLARAGARRGDEVRILDRAFEFLPEEPDRGSAPGERDDRPAEGSR